MTYLKFTVILWYNTITVTLMILRIDTTSSLPVYTQIIDQIKRGVATGVLSEGDPLPSLRETAVRLKINPLTVNKAYKILEQDGIVETRHGLGSFIAPNAERKSGDYRSQTIRRSINALLTEAMTLGMQFSQVRDMLDERIAEFEESEVEKRK